MELARRHLKTSSILVLLLAGLSFVQAVLEIFFGDLNHAVIPEGAPENILLITKIVLLSFTVLFLVPEIYIGIKGLRVAKKPNSSRGHIIWATVLFVLTIVSLIEPIVAIVTKSGAGDNVGMLLNFLLDAIIYFEYIRCAKAVAKGK